MAYKNKSKSRKHFGRKEYNETIEGRVQIKNKSYGKRQNSKEFLLTQTTWRREKKETKSRNREEIKAVEEKKGEESKSIPKAAARDKPHGEEKKKKPKARTEKK